jgi:hypothetical protein
VVNIASGTGWLNATAAASYRPMAVFARSETVSGYPINTPQPRADSMSKAACASRAAVTASPRRSVRPALTVRSMACHVTALRRSASSTRRSHHHWARSALPPYMSARMAVPTASSVVSPRRQLRSTCSALAVADSLPPFVQTLASALAVRFHGSCAVAASGLPFADEP